MMTSRIALSRWSVFTDDRGLRQAGGARGGPADAGAHPAREQRAGGAAHRHQRRRGHETRDAPVVQDGWRRAPHLRAGRRRGEARPAPRRDRTDRSQLAGRAGAANGRQGRARPQARRKSLCRPGHQPRAAAGPAHPGGDGRRAIQLRAVQPGLFGDQRAARRQGAAQTRRGTRADSRGQPGAGLRRERPRLRGARRARRSRDRQREARRQGRNPHGRISRVSP